jgi:hypothetical protein
MTVNVGKELAALQRLTIKELKARYADLFGELTNAANRAWLVKRIAWRLQALAEGDLSERARRRAAELANDADLRLSPPKLKVTPAEGTLTVAERTMTVTCLAAGRRFAEVSLSRIRRAFRRSAGFSGARCSHAFPKPVFITLLPASR